MESESENLRLDSKTDPNAVEGQAKWAQIEPGMRVADLGCGSGKTTAVLHRLVQPGGSAVGIDFSKGRIEYAREHHTADGAEFVCRDIRLPLDDLGVFDFLWIRFVLEYYRSNALEIVQNVSRILKPGGTLCLIDLDLNCMNHFGMSERLERTIIKGMGTLERANFDPYAGRKLYSYLYDAGYEDMAVDVCAHHVIFGRLGSVDAFNWMKKVETLSKKAAFDFNDYAGGFEEFEEEFTRFFTDPRRFSYTPLIRARGRNPLLV
jgi:ubiquinone/menaquinone biosynthesis C-methylase UbiE